MSLLGSIAWAINAVVWSVAFLAQGLEYSPIKSSTVWLLGLGFAFLSVMAIADGIRNRKR